MKVIIIFAARIVVAITFLYSGFVKLVDPVGSSYKFEEYFGSDVLDLEFLIPYTLSFSIVLIISEIMLGVSLLIGYKPTTTVWALFIMNLLFLFLTFYSAYYNKVTDCGCFGDALKLSPWNTFYKNVILMILIVPLVFNRSLVSSFFSEKILRNVWFLCLSIFLYVTYYVLVHLPIVDFRAYAIGKNIPEGMEYISGSDELPPIHDFFLESDSDDLTEKIVVADKVILIVSYDIETSHKSSFSAIKSLADKAIAKGYIVYGVSASSANDAINIQKEFALPFDFLFCDGTTLKTIIRSNPGIISIEKGTITGKWNWRDANEVFD